MKVGLIMMKEIEEICAAKLREIRRKRGLTLHGFEELSKGAVKAVVLGSYERGTRAISLERLEQLAELYEVPIQYFLGMAIEKEANREQGYIFDIRKIGRRSDLSSDLEAIKRYISSIARKRSDWNGEVISLRRTDSESLELMADLESAELRELLVLNGFLFAQEVNGPRSL